MPFAPPTPTTELIVDTFKELVWDLVVREALRKLFSKVAWLGWGPIGAFITHFALKYSDEIYSMIKEFIVIEGIILRNAEFKEAYGKSSVKLKIVAKNKGIDSPEFKEVRETNKKDLSKYVRFDVARAA